MLKNFRILSPYFEIIRRVPLVNSYVQRRVYSKKKEEQKKFTDTVRRPKKKSDKPLALLWEGMSLAEMAKAMNKSTDYVFECLFCTPYGDFFDKPSQRINDSAILTSIARVADYNIKFIQKKTSNLTDIVNNVLEEVRSDLCRQPTPDDSICVRRPPVVTIMGHVDHGKTTLLDFLRKSQIVQQEFGGITQHIGAFFVTLPDSNEKITFLDTPGHAAFKSMRARGARATDIVVLVVASDDGVMEQTRESIRFAREAKVSIVVAINKCDKHGVNIERVKHQLLAEGIQLEEYGGDVQAINISALKGTGVKDLQEAILLQAELLNVRGDPLGSVEGVVVESKISPGKGKVTTILVQRGTLKKGCILIAGTTWCRVKAMYDEHDKKMDEAKLSTPVQVVGWQDDILPSAGDEVLEAEDERRAREVLVYRKNKELEEKADKGSASIAAQRALEREMYEKKRWENYEKAKTALQSCTHRKNKWKQVQRVISSSNAPTIEKVYEDEFESEPELPIIIKGDVDGSVEALLEVCDTYQSTKCKFDVISFGVGPVTESDLDLASTFNGIIYAFNVKTLANVEQIAKQRQIEVRNFNIIYKLVDDLKLELSKRLPHLDEEEIVGEGIVLKQFLIPGPSSHKKIPVAGCRCVKGRIEKKNKIRIIRNDEVICEGEIEMMKKEKVDVLTANIEDEVGIMLSDIDKNMRFEKDDKVVCYKMIQVPQTIDWLPPGF